MSKYIVTASAGFIGS